MRLEGGAVYTEEEAWPQEELGLRRDTESQWQ